MSFQTPSYRTRAFFAANDGKEPAALSQADGFAGDDDTAAEGTLLFWSFHSGDTDGREGFVYQNEIGASSSFSKSVTGKIGWREAIEFLQGIETRSAQTMSPADEQHEKNFVRLHRSDNYTRAEPYKNHPMLRLESYFAQIDDISGAAPKLQPRRKQTPHGGPR